MNEFTDQEIQKLLQMQGDPCVSISFPTDPLNSDPRINSIACKNLVNKALNELGNSTSSVAKSLQAFLDQYLDDPVFWKEIGSGFVIYACGETLLWHKLPVAVPELALISDRPYLLHMLASRSTTSEYFVLKLDKDDTQMWKGSDGQLQRVEVPDLPKSVEEVTGREQNERQLQFHTGTSTPSGSQRAAMFHGNSSWKDDKDRYLEMFLNAVDRAVVAFCNDRQPLLFLSGVEEPVVMYRKVSKYQNLHPTDIPRNDKSESEQGYLARQVQPFLEELEEKALQNHLSTYIEEPHQDRKIVSLPEILNAAFQGRVATLFVAENEHVWGVFDPNTLSTVVESQQAPTLTELLNEAARLTLQNSGEVVVMPRELIPEDSQIVARLRY